MLELNVLFLAGAGTAQVMQQEVLKQLIWTDYRLAVLFIVLLPLGLLIWSFVEKSAAVQRLLIIYWRVASLLAITVYLAIGGLPISFATGIMVRILIPISLWFWADLNEEINDLPQQELKLALTSWRWAITIYCIIGVLFQIPYLGCAFSSNLLSDRVCSLWLEAPWQFGKFFHPNFVKLSNLDRTPPTAPSGFLGFMGIMSLIIYVLYLGNFLVFRLGKQGRSAMEQ